MLTKIGRFLGDTEILTIRGLFMWNGRRNRKPFNFLSLLFMLVSLVVNSLLLLYELYVGNVELILESTFYTVFIFSGYTVFAYCSFVNTIKRLHDLGHSGKIFTYCVSLFFLCFLVVNVHFLAGVQIVQMITNYIAIGLSVVLFVFLLYFMFFKGTTGPNKYGPDPLGIVEISKNE